MLAAVFAVATVIGAVLAPFTPAPTGAALGAFALSYCLVELASLVAAGILWLRHAVPSRCGAARASSVGRRQRGPSGVGARAGAAARRGDTSASRSSSSRAPTRTDSPGRIRFWFWPVTVARVTPFALVHLLLTRYHRSVRIVLKDILQLDPALDLLSTA